MNGLSTAVGKLRSAITYLAINEVMTFLGDVGVDYMDIALVGVVLYVLSGSFLHSIKRNVGIGGGNMTESFVALEARILQSVNRLSIMLSAQAVARWVRPDAFDNARYLSLEQVVFMILWVVTMLAVLSLLPGGFVQTEQGASFQSVLLYTFTDGIEVMFSHLRLNPLILFMVALVLLYYLQTIHFAYVAYCKERGVSLNTFRNISHEAMCMVLANVCIAGVMKGDDSAHSYKNVLLLAQYVAGVIFVSFLAKHIQLAASVQMLILWRASREVWDWINLFTTDKFIIIACLGLAYGIMKKVQTDIAMTLMLVLAKQLVNSTLEQVSNLPQLPSIVASHVILVMCDVLAGQFINK
jgi:hypothetical protein